GRTVRRASRGARLAVFLLALLKESRVDALGRERAVDRARAPLLEDDAGDPHVAVPHREVADGPRLGEAEAPRAFLDRARVVLENLAHVHARVSAGEPDVHSHL